MSKDIIPNAGSNDILIVLISILGMILVYLSRKNSKLEDIE